MNSLLQKTTIFLFFVLQANILSTLGIDTGGKISYLFLLLGFSLYGLHLLENPRKRIFCLETLMVVLYLLMIAEREIMGILPESIMYSTFLIIPILLTLAIPNGKKRQNISLQRFFFKCCLIYLSIEILLGAFEFVTKTHVLTWIDNVYDSHLDAIQTRPVGLSGASLTNSYILSAFSFMILQMPLKKEYKIGAWLTCIIGLVCYQGRMALAFSLLYMLVYLSYKSMKREISLIYLVLALGSILLFISIFFVLGLGERFTDMEDDSSALMRLQALEYLSNLSAKDFIWGTSLVKMQEVQDDMGVVILEIAYVMHVLIFGLIFATIFWVGTMIFAVKRRFTESKFLSVVAIVFFFALITTGIGWASGYYAVAMFMLINKLFSDDKVYNVIPHRYLDKTYLHQYKRGIQCIRLLSILEHAKLIIPNESKYGY